MKEGLHSLVDLRKTTVFVKSLGDEILKARLEAIIKGRRPRRRILEKIQQMRKTDGGFAFWEEDVSSITTTLNVVGWLDDLSLRDGPVVDETFDFLLSHQQEDGGWDEIAEVRDVEPLPYMMPGELNTRIWLTACCAHWFIRFGRAEPPGAKGCPAEFLMQHVIPSGLISGYLYASWDALVMFNYHPGSKSDVFRNLLTEVRERLDPDEHDATDLAWLLRCLRDIDLSVEDDLVSRAINTLMSMQRPDGSWSSSEGERYIGMTTIDAIRVLHDFGKL